ncbi:MAG: ABC transporter permease subunit [Planctomycetes bacterium]|nr:ABC transporter permease subunit [Planctomycetota bacterium]
MGEFIIRSCVILFLAGFLGLILFGLMNRVVRAVMVRELRNSFDSPIAYVFIILFLLATGVMYAWVVKGGMFSKALGVAQVDTFFQWMPLYLCLVAPAVTMRVWAEEKRTGTYEVLLTLPVRDTEVVLGKYLAAAALVTLAILLTLSTPLIVDSLADSAGLDWAEVTGYYAGSVLVGLMYVAVGAFVSSITRDQIIAFLVSLVLLAALWALGLPDLLNEWPRLSEFFRAISPGARFENVAQGVLDSRDMLYFFSATALGLVLNLFTVSARKWRI